MVGRVWAAQWWTPCVQGAVCVKWGPGEGVTPQRSLHSVWLLWPQFAPSGSFSGPFALTLARWGCCGGPQSWAICFAACPGTLSQASLAEGIPSHYPNTQTCIPPAPLASLRLLQLGDDVSVPGRLSRTSFMLYG